MVGCEYQGTLSFASAPGTNPVPQSKLQQFTTDSAKAQFVSSWSQKTQRQQQEALAFYEEEQAKTKARAKRNSKRDKSVELGVTRNRRKTIE
jgi:ABC-type transporter MlaC component